MRLPVMIGEDVITIPELNYMLVGEKMSEGYSLYSEIWENIAPLSAAVYMVLDYLFGRSQVAFQIMALFVVFFQCVVFNRLLLLNKAYNESTYIPGLIYGILMSVYFDFMTLTPALMGITFLLLALNNIFSHIEFRAKRDEEILNIGLYLGISCLFYLPNVIFGLATLIIFIFFTGTIARRYLLLVFGFMLPLLIVATFYLALGRFSLFFNSFINPLIDFTDHIYIEGTSLLVLFSIPLLFWLLSLIRINQRARFTNYQARLTQAMFVWSVFCFLFVLLGNLNAPNIYQVFVPALAFYLSHYFLLIRRRYIAEMVFLVFFFGIIFTSVSTYFDLFKVNKYININGYIAEHSLNNIVGKKVLVLDNDLRYYRKTKQATPFLDWQMAQGVFTNLNYYDNVTILYEGFINDLPEVIIDPHNVMPAVLEKIPALESKYVVRGGKYYLKD